MGKWTRKMGEVGGTSIPNRRGETKPRCHTETRQDKSQRNGILFSLSFSRSHSCIQSRVNVTSVDAFHSQLAVPAGRCSVKPISITKWPFLSSLPSVSNSFTPFTTIHLSNGMHLGIDESLHSSVKTFNYISKGEGTFIVSCLRWLGGKRSASYFTQRRAFFSAVTHVVQFEGYEGHSSDEAKQTVGFMVRLY